MIFKKIGIMILKIIGIIWFLLGVIMAVSMYSVRITDSFIEIVISIIFLLVGAVGLIPMIKWRKKKPPRPQQEYARAELENLNNEMNNLQDVLRNPSNYITVTAKTEVPAEVYTQMRSSYSLDQAERDIEILTDCYTICSTSNNLETVILRMELGTRKAYTLMQAEDAGILETSLIRKKIAYFRSGQEEILSQALWRGYAQELDKIKKIKTDAGKKEEVDNFIDNTESVIMPFVMDKNDGVILHEELWGEWSKIKNLLQQHKK